MSFGISSRDQNVNKQYTTLWLTGGYDCTTNARNLHVDLRVQGGVYIGKSLCVTGNVCADKILTEIIFEKHVGEGIDIVGNVYVDPSYVLFANNACLNTLYVDIIHEKLFGEGINITSNVNMMAGTVLSADNIIATSIDSVFIKSNIAETLLLESDQITSNIILADQIIVEKELANLILSNTIISDIVCINQKLFVDTILPKTGNTVVIDGNLFVTGNTNIGNIHFNLSNIVANIVCINQELLVDTIKPKTGNTISVIGNINIDGNITSNYICIKDALLVDNIKPKSGNTIVIDGNVFFTGNTNITATAIVDYKRTVVNTPLYNINITDDILAVLYSTTGMTTLNLPKITTLPNKRKKYIVVDEGGSAGTNAIVIIANITDSILGSSMVQINGNYNSIQIYSNESNGWFYF